MPPSLRTHSFMVSFLFWTQILWLIWVPFGDFILKNKMEKNGLLHTELVDSNHGNEPTC